jgi:hypothetical protein
MASNGLAWALGMLGLDLVELLALMEVVFGEPHRNPAFKPNVIITIYFWVAVVSMLLQIIGTLLVTRGRYRAGGMVQIISNTVHLPKGDGLIGLIGGLKAYRYPEVLAAQQAAAAASS